MVVSGREIGQFIKDFSEKSKYLFEQEKGVQWEIQRDKTWKHLCSSGQNYISEMIG